MTKQHPFIIILMIVLVATLTQICTDIYTPSIPAIAHHLGTTIGQTQLTMTYFIAGVAFTNLIYGPLSEGIGRRWTLIIGISIAIIGTLLCLVSTNIHMLQAGRLIQGCGLGATAGLWRSIFRDTYSTEELAHKASFLTTFLIMSVILAPFLGGYFEQYLGWHATFIFLLCWMVFILLLILFKFEESNQHHGRHRLNLKFVYQSYRELLTHRLFIAYSVMIFLTFGGLFAWITAGPAILIHGVGIQPVYYGYLMLITGIATGLATMLNTKLLKRFSLHTIIVMGLLLMSLSGIALFIAYYSIGLYGAVVVIPAAVFVFGASFLFMNCFALAFANVGHIAGYAGALYACIQLLGGMIFSGILGHLNTSTPVPMAIMFSVSGIGAGLIYFIAGRHKNNESAQVSQG